MAQPQEAPVAAAGADMESNGALARLQNTFELLDDLRLRNKVNFKVHSLPCCHIVLYASCVLRSLHARVTTRL